MATDSNELWQFALSYYEDLKKPLLSLQSKGVRVNWVLAALWLATQTRGWPNIDDADLRELHELRIKPWRAQRMALKNVDAKAYEQAKRAEIELEKAELAALYDLLIHSNASAVNDVFAFNLRAVMGQELACSDDALELKAYFQL